MTKKPDGAYGRITHLGKLHSPLYIPFKERITAVNRRKKVAQVFPLQQASFSLFPFSEWL